MTEHEKLVERVARVIDPLAFVEASPLADPEGATRQARAAIATIYEAMKEPSADMLTAAIYAEKPSRPTVGEALKAEWDAMLAASPLTSNKTGDE